MKRERIFAFLLSVVMAFALSVGTVGCLISGFDLPLQDGNGLTLICAMASLIGSFLLLWKWGGGVIAAALALLAGYLWRRGIAWEQIFALFNRISHVYDSAYGWGVFSPTESTAPADLPMAILGTLVALSASRTMCRGKGTWLTVFLSAVPLASCLVVTDTVPDEAYLLALLAGLILLILPAGVRHDSVFQSNRLTAMLTLPVVLALGILFAAIPQEGYVNQSKEIQDKLLSLIEDVPHMVQTAVEDVATDVQGGDQKNVDLKSLGARIQYTYPVMEVTADQGGILYLRGQDYDSYTGTGWTASSHRAEDFGADGEPAGTVTIRTRNEKDLLYLPYYPGSAATLVGGMVKNPDGAREYTWTAAALPENWKAEIEESHSSEGGIALTAMEVQAFGSTAERLRYVTLPGEADVRAQEILKTILPENASRVEMAEAIAKYVRNSAEYDLSTGRMPSDEGDFALWFLTESDTGYCVHFATAAVVLLRAADIPARYVTGYMAEAQEGQTVTVTAGNAHAWAEYYVPQLETWVVLEATPAEALYIPDEDAALETDAPAPVPETSGEAVIPETTLPGESEAPTTVTEAPPEPEAPVSGSQWKGVPALILLVSLLIFQRPARLSIRKNAQRSGSNNRQALARWRETELLCRLLKQPPPEELTELAQKAKFSQHTLTSEELARFDAHRRSCIHRMRQKPWYRQLIYRFIWAVY